MIRAGETSDIPAIVEMARQFWQHTQYDDDYQPEAVEGMSQACIDSGLMSVLVVDDKVEGFACGLKGPLLANFDVLAGVEVAWWVNPDHRAGRNGIALLKHIEKAAKDAGLKYWSMIFMQSSMPDAIEQIYIKMGYKKAETTYTKRLA